MRNVNLTVNSLNGKPARNCGKLVSHKGKPCLHQWIQQKWARRDLQAWGINISVLEYIEKHGATDIYLYSASDDKTFHVPVGLLKEYGTESSPHDWGFNLNLPIEEWSVIPGKISVPWVDEKCAVKLQPKPPEVKPVEPEKESECDIARPSLL